MLESKMILGIAGPAGSGKDTAGAWLAEHYGFKRYAMASALKAGMAAMGFPEPADRALKEQPVPGFDFTWREAAQKLGTEWGRKLDSDLWVKVAERQVRESKDSVVITDIRFENESAMVRRMGGTVIHLLGRKADLGENQQHASEVGISISVYYDYVIDNSDSLETLYEQLEGLMNV